MGKKRIISELDKIQLELNKPADLQANVFYTDICLAYAEDMQALNQKFEDCRSALAKKQKKIASERMVREHEHS